MIIKDEIEYLTKKEAVEKFNISEVYLNKYKKYGLKTYIFDEIEYFTEKDKSKFDLLPNFYVYIVFDGSKKGVYSYGSYSFEYEPFYVGKGKFDRYKMHLEKTEINAKRNINSYKNNKIKKLKRENKEIIIEKYYINLFETDALQKEEILIKTIGLKENGGPLTNLTNGGEAGANLSRESKAKMIASKKEWYKHNIHPMQGKKHSPETIEKFKKRPHIKWTKEQKQNLKKIRCAHKNKSQTLKWKCINPNGEEFIVYGLGEFCRNNNLQQAHMFLVAKGDRLHHKGWKCEYYESKD
jgi:hypothetical protein